MNLYYFCYKNLKYLPLPSIHIKLLVTKVSKEGRKEGRKEVSK